MLVIWNSLQNSNLGRGAGCVLQPGFIYGRISSSNAQTGVGNDGCYLPHCQDLLWKVIFKAELVWLLEPVRFCHPICSLPMIWFNINGIVGKAAFLWFFRLYARTLTFLNGDKPILYYSCLAFRLLLLLIKVFLPWTSKYERQPRLVDPGMFWKIAK